MISMLRNNLNSKENSATSRLPAENKTNGILNGSSLF
jgi:hypothetical protein